jgi:hypothetical protein
MPKTAHPDLDASGVFRVDTPAAFSLHILKRPERESIGALEGVAMTVKALSNVRSLGAVLPASPGPTYSIASSVSPYPEESSVFHSVEVESFLEEENPLGCIRGVMWVMVFNVAVFLAGIVIWQSCKHLW